MHLFQGVHNKLLYDDDVMLAQVMKVEKALNIESSSSIINNIPKKYLETAAEIFLYLNSCPFTAISKRWYKSWFIFYNDLFKTQQPNKIILTLNRLMKSNTEKNRHVKLMASKLMEKATILMELKNEELRRMLPGGTWNASVFGDHDTIKGFTTNG